MQRVEPGRHDDRRAHAGPQVRQLVEHQVAVHRPPDQHGVLHRRDHHGLPDLQRLDHQELGQPRHHRDAHQQHQLQRRGGPRPDEGQRHRKRQAPHQPGIGHRRHRAVAVAQHPADDLAQREQPRRHQHEDHRRVDHPRAGADHDQRADEADGDRRPAPDAHRLAQHQPAHQGDEERRHEGHRHRVGQRHEAHPDDEQRGRECRHPAPRDLHPGMRGPQDPGAAHRQQHQHAQEQAQLPGPDDLDRVQRLGQELRLRVDGGKDEHSREHVGQGQPVIRAPRAAPAHRARLLNRHAFAPRSCPPAIGPGAGGHKGRPRAGACGWRAPAASGRDKTGFRDSVYPERPCQRGPDHDRLPDHRHQGDRRQLAPGLRRHRARHRRPAWRPLPVAQRQHRHDRGRAAGHQRPRRRPVPQPRGARRLRGRPRIRPLRRGAARRQRQPLPRHRRHRPGRGGPLPAQARGLARGSRPALPGAPAGLRREYLEDKVGA